MVAGSVKGKGIAVVVHPRGCGNMPSEQPAGNAVGEARGTPERILEASQVGASGSVWPSEAATVLLTARTY